MKKLRSIEDMLVEMKNTSELMVDLAYSALLFNNKEIAEEL
ncbi:MAG: potassium channel family protein, partial [Candidatus Freyarchaeota archaeon]